jgi:hypothetical protein
MGRPTPGELWHATGFTDAELPYSDLLQADGQRMTVLEFFRVRPASLDKDHAKPE